MPFLFMGIDVDGNRPYIPPVLTGGFLFKELKISTSVILNTS
jgi:hypothetical protein